jgi:GDPmannose 4,6-dehydratase
MGNLDAKRDWGHAKDYVYAMWLMLQHHRADDFVIATGVTTTVREFIIKAFRKLGITVEFKGRDLMETGYVAKVSNSDVKVKIGQEVVKIDAAYFRPTEVDLLIGDATKARQELGWGLKYDLDGLIDEMVKSDMELFQRDHYLKSGGHKIFQYHE